MTMKLRLDANLGPLLDAHFANVPDVQQEVINAAQNLLLGGASEEAISSILTGRTDSNTPYSTRDELIQNLARVFETRYAKNTAADLFDANTELRPGVLGWRAKRVDYTGEPELIGDGGNTTDTPAVELTEDEEIFPVLYWSLDVAGNFLQTLANEAVPSAMRSRAKKLQAAQAAHARKHNSVVWGGGPTGTKFYGFLRNPWVNRFYAMQAIGMGENGKAMRDLLNYIIAFTTDDLEGWTAEMAPNVLGMSGRMLQVIRLSTWSDNTDTTILKFLLENAGIERIVEVPELKNAGGTDVDAVIAFNDSIPGSFERMEVLPFMALPAQAHGLKTLTPTVSGHGGMLIAEPLGAIISMVPYSRLN